MAGPLPWYVARASGLVAWLLLAGAMLWGLALSTKVFGRRRARTGCSTCTRSWAAPNSH